MTNRSLSLQNVILTCALFSVNLKMIKAEGCLQRTCSTTANFGGHRTDVPALHFSTIVQ